MMVMLLVWGTTLRTIALDNVYSLRSIEPGLAEGIEAPNYLVTVYRLFRSYVW